MNKFSKLVVIAMLLLVASSNAVKAQDDGLFSKTFPDGSRVYLTVSTITEFRSRPRSVNSEAPEQEIYSDREWKLVTYTLLLKRPAVDKEEKLWREDFEYAVADQKMFYVIGTLTVKDLLLNGDRAYLLYSQEGFVSVVNLTRNKDREWIWSAPADLAHSTDVYPIIKWIFTSKTKPQIAIDAMVHGKVRTSIWNLKGERGVWVKKK